MSPAAAACADQPAPRATTSSPRALRARTRRREFVPSLHRGRQEPSAARRAGTPSAGAPRPCPSDEACRPCGYWARPGPPIVRAARLRRQSFRRRRGRRHLQVFVPMADRLDEQALFRIPPGTMAGPVAPPLRNASRESRRRSPSSICRLRRCDRDNRTRRGWGGSWPRRTRGRVGGRSVAEAARIVRRNAPGSADAFVRIRNRRTGTSALPGKAFTRSNPARPSRAHPSVGNHARHAGT